MSHPERSEHGTRINVLIVDDHPLVRQGLEVLINQQDDMVVCGQAGDLREAMSAIQSSRPHLAVVDLALNNESGLNLIADIKKLHPDVLTLALSMHDENLYAERALRAGARGYVMKSENPRRLIEGIREVMSGRVFLSNAISTRLLTPVEAGADSRPPLFSLTDRELEVFRLLAEGHNSREMAARLGISIKTVEVHRQNIKNKLGLRHSTELVKKAVEIMGALPRPF